MNKEFKQIKTSTETRYVLESMTAGGTGASNVASAPGTVGKIQKRSDNILAQEADKKKKIPPSTPRNFVAKNAKTSGAGAHTDKRKEIPRKEKHKKPTFEDHEIQMASSELQTAAKEAVQILKMIQQYGESQGLEAWQQSKITKAADYLHSVVQSISGQQRLAEGAVKKLDADIKDKTINNDAFKKKHGMSKADAKKQLATPKTNTKPVSEEAGKVCQQCGMKGCTCTPGKCKCTPKPGYPKKQVVAEEYTTEKQISTRIRQIMHDRKLSGTDSNAGELQRLKQQLKDIRNRQDVKEGTFKYDKKTGQMGHDRSNPDQRHGLFINGRLVKTYNSKPEAENVKRREPRFKDAEIKPIDPSVSEGAKVDRQAAHITKSMMKKGKTKKQAQSIAWAHIKHPKKVKESKDSYIDSLFNRLNK